MSYGLGFSFHKRRLPSTAFAKVELSSLLKKELILEKAVEIVPLNEGESQVPMLVGTWQRVFVYESYQLLAGFCQ